MTLSTSGTLADRGAHLRPRSAAPRSPRRWSAASRSPRSSPRSVPAGTRVPSLRHHRQARREGGNRDAEHRLLAARSPRRAPARRRACSACTSAFSFSGRFLRSSGETQQRHQRERQDQRADQGRSHRAGHRREDASLVALQREDRDVRGDDDQHREQRRPADLDRGIEDLAAARSACDLAVRGLATACGTRSPPRSPRRRR